MGEHIGATWRIRLNRPSVAAVRPYVKLLWPLVSIFETVNEGTGAIEFYVFCCSILDGLFRWSQWLVNRQQSTLVIVPVTWFNYDALLCIMFTIFKKLLYSNADSGVDLSQTSCICIERDHYWAVMQKWNHSHFWISIPAIIKVSAVTVFSITYSIICICYSCMVWGLIPLLISVICLMHCLLIGVM